VTWRRSLRLRLVLGAAVWITLALAVAGSVIAGLFEQHVRQRFEAELGHHLDQLVAALEFGPTGAPVVARPLSDPLFQRPLSGLYWQVEGPSGALQRSRSLWDTSLNLPPEPQADSGLHRHRIGGPNRSALIALDRLVILPGGPDAYRAVVAMDETEVDRAIQAFTRSLVVSLGVLAVALIVAALFQIELGLRPLARLRRELALVRSRRQSRLSGSMPTEVLPLTEDLNALLDQSQQVVGRARAQAGNLAHALKTNLAILGNAAQSLEPDKPAGEAGVLIAEQVGLMRRHIDHHLARARAAAARNVPGVATSVRTVAIALKRTMERLHCERGMVIAIERLGDDVVRVEQQDLEEMLGNLLDNACKWARRRIDVTSRRVPCGMVTIIVDDDGAGLSGGAAMPSRGVRLDESVPGSGLGLAIVQDLAGLYGGILTLDGSPSGGLRAELTLPATPSDPET
jgi:signal transduction histidine kinase